MRQKLFWQRFCIYNRSENCWAAQLRTVARQLGNIKYFWHRCSGWEGRGKKTSQGEKCGDYIDNDPRFGINYELLIFRSHISLHTAQLRTRPSNDSSVFTITQKAPYWAFSWLKAPTSAFAFTLLRHHAKWVLTDGKEVKLECQGHKGWSGRPLW